VSQSISEPFVATKYSSEKRNAYRVLVGTAKGMNHLADLGINERIILKLS
jgi:hypothetical protein